MTWITVAFIAPLLWSLINHTDKYLVTKYFKGGGVGALMIFVGIISAPLAAAIFFTYRNVFDISTIDMWILIATGILYNVTVLFYLYALQDNDASTIVPFWQLAPVFAYIFGGIFLREYLSSEKLLASILVIGGAVLLSLDLSQNKLKVKKKIIFMMFISAISIGLSNTLFKKAALDNYDFWILMFWNQIGMLFFAVVCYFIKSYRHQFFLTIQRNSAKILSISIFEQIVETIAIIVNNYAILLAPAALIVLIEYSAQPFFVFIFGIVLSILFPKFIKEDLTKKNLVIKLVSIIIMSIGVNFILN
jgi:drug/metabolite transporter (DMT)-like permease